MKVVISVNSEKHLLENELPQNYRRIFPSEKTQVSFISISENTLTIVLNKEPECICIDESGDLWLEKILCFNPKVLWEKESNKEVLDCIS